MEVMMRSPKVVLAPPSQLIHSSSLLDLMINSPSSQIVDIPKSPFARLMMTPIASPMRKALSSIGQFTKLDHPHDAWLPITESQNGNVYYAAFHTLSSGIGIQALVLPIAFTTLGWTWGIICLSLAFVWQLYTLWLLIQLHEHDSGIRYSRYLRLSIAAFGEKKGKLLALLPIMYLSGGTCVTLIMIGGGTMKIFSQIVSGDGDSPLTAIQWYIVFTCAAIIIAQLPNLNSIAGVSLIGAITAVSYCTVIWVVSIIQGRPQNVSYEPLQPKSTATTLCSVLNALGIIAFSFRGHNLVLEIQATMPTSAKNPSRIPMWRGVTFAYSLIAMCIFPLAICGYWIYGNLIPTNGGMLAALYKYHGQDTSKTLIGLTCLLVVINCLSSFQIYAMPVFDNLEFKYTTKFNKPCPKWVRSGFRVFYGCLAFFISVALPFLPSLAGLIGGIALPVTLAYPCFMWILIKNPEKYNASWWLNCGLGVLGMVLSVSVITGGIWYLVNPGIEIHFFKPE